MTNYKKAQELEQRISDAICAVLETEQDVSDAKEYFAGMTVNEYIEQESKYITDSDTV